MQGLSQGPCTHVRRLPTLFSRQKGDSPPRTETCLRGAQGACYRDQCRYSHTHDGVLAANQVG